MRQLSFTSGSEEETSRFAAGFARLLSPGDTVLLRGQLGAGKTFFVRAAARALGVTVPVTSPSFTMANSYQGEMLIHHLDLYRLPVFDIQAEADFSDFFADDAITFIEWPEAIEGHIAGTRAVIDMKHIDEHSRELRISTTDPSLPGEVEALIDSPGD
ncbi:MAG: tRNA (adenosine(37)-N6)-threonylcarbamoyltransferase complex ATPase subunit type 1 TsaE [Thermoleophilia bacterium]